MGSRTGPRGLNYGLTSFLMVPLSDCNSGGMQASTSDIGECSNYEENMITSDYIHVCMSYPFTLRVPLESIVCYSHTFENILGIK